MLLVVEAVGPSLEQPQPAPQAGHHQMLQSAMKPGRQVQAAELTLAQVVALAPARVVVLAPVARRSRLPELAAAVASLSVAILPCPHPIILISP